MIEYILRSHQTLILISKCPARAADDFAASLSGMYPSAFDDTSRKIDK
ncbi:hypothetical protein X011_03270 [Mycobacterium tuberculosis variant microti OV254]|nr:hypothetical protein X011_03270 [Mycobacterium tuberculosis variant microti OV254]